jgi:DMSO/TMAO reductase YedYZ molybdopterin-dependent catalytic subunit
MTTLGTGGLLCGLERPELFAARPSGLDALTGGEFLGRVEFANEGRVEMDTAFGSELDGRLFTALDGINEKSLVTPEEKFYLRTRASKLLPDPAGWKIDVDGLRSLAKAPRAGNDSVAAEAATPNDVPKQGRGKLAITVAQLREREKPLGLHLLECAGNTRAAHFGMISVGEWAGVALGPLLEELTPLPGATRVLVNGFDQYAANSVTSTPGASWIFAIEELKSAGAFLALKLDGKPLSPDHGAPVRLVVPGWYGCACIKWVDRITFVDENAEATSQMTEYAGRTQQHGSPRLAREFAPARIEHAAMPIRVEKWRVAGHVKYRVVGLLWGETSTVKALGIRFNPEEEYLKVERLTVPQTTPWTLWSHTWTPAAKGIYTIRLAVLEPPEKPTRLESGYYARSVEIEEI